MVQLVWSERFAERSVPFLPQEEPKNMKTRTLGRTGLEVSLIGMGTGGLDPLGVNSGRSEAEMKHLLRRAFDLGINLFDTAPGYADGRSERILGCALADLPRDEVVVSTKIPLVLSVPGASPRVMKRTEVEPYVEGSLRRLQTDYVDIMLIAAADIPQFFDQVIENLVPELLTLRDKGKLNFIGATESTRSDGEHIWLQRVLPTDLVDVAMVGHNMINQSAQRTVFPICIRKDLGVLNVFTVRNLFWNAKRLTEVVADLKKRGVLADDAVSDENPLGWLVAGGDCGSLVEAAYRYVAYTRGVTAVMCGTTDVAELEENVETVQKGPLAADMVERLKLTFGHISEPVGN
jgi:aryl-alcohol dehydrogenase-like predicted oxidoreductase